MTEVPAWKAQIALDALRLHLGELGWSKADIAGIDICCMNAIIRRLEESDDD